MLGDSPTDTHWFRFLVICLTARSYPEWPEYLFSNAHVSLPDIRAFEIDGIELPTRSLTYI
jgi:hypothetical protein